MQAETLPPITMIGHPFAILGIGRTHRMVFKALKAVGVDISSLDVYGGSPQVDRDAAALIIPHLTTKFSSNINIFTLNADEVEPSLAHLQMDLPRDAYNIVVPFWELGKYPQAWGDILSRFDEVWAFSNFVADALRPQVRATITPMTHPIEPLITRFMGRRAFDIPEAAYAFLFNFDFRSYSARKNPEGILAAYEKVLAERPAANTVLVLKVTGFKEHPEALEALRQRTSKYNARVIIIAAMLDDNANNNLVRNCDCFVSLHRSEGFGQGMADAMFYGRPAIGTGYSGNMDYMSAENSLLVPYKMIDLKPGDYPHAEGQQWADADTNVAADMMIKLIDQPDWGRAVGVQGATDVQTQLSTRATGCAYRARLEEIWVERQKQANAA